MLDVKSIVDLFLSFVEFFSRPNKEFDKPMIFFPSFIIRLTILLTNRLRKIGSDWNEYFLRKLTYLAFWPHIVGSAATRPWIPASSTPRARRRPPASRYPGAARVRTSCYLISHVVMPRCIETNMKQINEVCAQVDKLPHNIFIVLI